MAIMTNSALPDREIEVPDETVWVHEMSGWVVKSDTPWTQPPIVDPVTAAAIVDALPDEGKRGK